MSTILIVVIVVVGLLALLVLGPRVLMALRGSKLKGKPAPLVHKPSAGRIKSGAPTVLYFFTPTCRACVAQDPVMRRMQKRYPDAIFKINAQTHRQAASAYGVMGVPYLAFIQDGTVVAAKAGVQQEAAITAFLGKGRRVRPASETATRESRDSRMTSGSSGSRTKKRRPVPATTDRES